MNEKRIICKNTTELSARRAEREEFEWFADDIRYYSKKLHNVKNGFILE